MDDRIRMKHLTGKSVRDFTNQHPSNIEGHAAATAELGQVVDRMDAVDAMFETGRREATAASQEKDRLIGVIQAEFVGPIAAIARGNGAIEAGLARRFKTPRPEGDRTAYLGAARAIRDLAAERKTIFVGDGMPTTFVEDFGQALSAYDATAIVRNTNHQLHVQARAELRALAAQVMRLIKRLDGINRARFRKDPHLLEAWQAARNLSWPVAVVAKPAAPVQDNHDSAA